MFPEHNEQFRFGSAEFADERDLARAGMFDQSPNALLVGFFGSRPLWYSGAGGLLLTAGARSGKLRDVLAYNVCAGICRSSMVILDMKGELAAISRDLTPDRKYGIYWNPARLHGLPQDRINPVDYLTIDSPSLVSDAKVLAENLIPLSGSANAAYFEGRAREFLEAIILTLARMNGVLTLPDLTRAVNLIPSANAAWLDFAFEMSESGFPLSARVEEEIAAARDNSSGGFSGIIGELFKAVAALSDPALMESVSPPYDFSLSQLCDSSRGYQLYLMPPAEFVEGWSPVIKALFVGAMIYKARAPSAPRQTWILDECAQLGNFPLVVKLFTYGAGIGIRPWAIFQSTHQMEALGKDAGNIIASSAALRSYFALRDIASAEAVSRMLGAQTLEYDDEAAQARSRHAKNQALNRLLGDDDPFGAGFEFAHHAHAESLRTKQHRLLRTPAELLVMPDDRQIIFADGISKPIWAGRRSYQEQRFMAGRYHPNPYHPPADRVRVKTLFGHEWRRVCREPVPPEFAHYPQYQDGTWSVIR